MKPSCAAVLCQIARLAPCTKLCVKQHSGLAMATVLAAVDTLCEEGWIRCDTLPAPQGGKPHASLTLGERRFWGVRGGASPVFASASPDGEVRIERELPPNVEGFCVHEAYGGVPLLDKPKALCYARNLSAPTAVIDEDLRVFTPRKTLVLGDLPSPMLGATRLTYLEAMAIATPSQRAKLRRELTVLVGRFEQVERVLFAQDVEVGAQDAALAALYSQLYLSLS